MHILKKKDSVHFSYKILSNLQFWIVSLIVSLIVHLIASHINSLIVFLIAFLIVA